MSIEKAVIENTDTGDKIEVLFNPKEYVLEKRTPWIEHSSPTFNSPAVQFLSGERVRLSMELFFDTSEEKTDVRDHTKKIEELMMINSDKHRPPILMFSWGQKLNFKCVLEDLVQRYTMFKQDGTPIRAILKVLFKEFSEKADDRKKNPLHSADHTKRIMLREGETLSSICAREYADPRKWRVIADANKINDPTSIKAGTVLRLPPLY